MIRIAVCDDEKYMTAKIENLIMDISRNEGIDIDISVFFDGSSLKKNIMDGNIYDLIYLDIEMKELNGVEAARCIREVNEQVLLIYVSSYESYLKELFEVEPFRFISKPIDNDFFKLVFLKAYRKIMSSNEYFEFRYNREFQKVLMKDIQFFESDKRTVNIYTDEEVFKFYGKLNEIEDMLKNSKNNFLRIHRSYLVNYNHIKRIGVDFVEMEDGTIHEMSINRQKQIRAKYCKLVGGDRIG